MIHKIKSLLKSNFAFTALVFTCTAIIILFFLSSTKKPNLVEGFHQYLVEKNYGKDIEKYAEKFNLPADYFKALANLECSGNNNNPNRFEPKVYEEILKVQQGKRKRYGYITRDMIDGASEQAIKNLATSWGPFQLLGYKCLQMGVYVHDIRGKHAVYWGMKWIKHEYGHLLDSNRYIDAFHYHNTGRVFPKDSVSLTFDPDYVKDGIKYMEQF